MILAFSITNLQTSLRAPSHRLSCFTLQVVKHHGIKGPKVRGETQLQLGTFVTEVASSTPHEVDRRTCLLFILATLVHETGISLNAGVADVAGSSNYYVPSNAFHSCAVFKNRPDSYCYIFHFILQDALQSDLKRTSDCPRSLIYSMRDLYVNLGILGLYLRHRLCEIFVRLEFHI